MKFADTLHGLLRRWYIVFPGIIIAVSIALGAWFVIPAGYERSATQLLIPGANSMPVGANPYLYLGGLSPAADVLVRAIGSQNVLNEVVKEHPGVQIDISRDTTTAGPIILITVTASSDASAKEVLGLLIERTARVLNEFQQVENIPVKNRVTVIPITVDDHSMLQQRNRLLGAAGAGIAGVVLTLLAAGLVNGLSQRRQREAQGSEDDTEGASIDEAGTDAPDVGEPDTVVETDTMVETSTVVEPEAPDPAGITAPARAAANDPAPPDSSPDVLSDEQAPAVPPLRN